MKLLQNRVLISKGSFPGSPVLQEVVASAEIAMATVVWPEGSDRFTINPQRKGNGVVPIKTNFMAHLASEGWQLEYRLSTAATMRPGPIDAVKELNDGRFFAVEWETGNISSSHRALNKMALGLITGKLAGGILLLPSKKTYTYLTDRVGNFAEIECYFPFWEELVHLPRVTDAYLSVMEFEYDDISSEVPLIGKGTDGRAKG